MESNTSNGRLATAGGVIAALLASSCCVGPLILVTFGVSGAWIGNLSALEPIKPYFAVVALVCLGLGFWQIYHKPENCEDGANCAKPLPRRISKVALWSATLLVIVALTINWWAPLFY